MYGDGVIEALRNIVRCGGCLNVSRDAARGINAFGDGGLDLVVLPQAVQRLPRACGLYGSILSASIQHQSHPSRRYRTW